MEKIASGRLVLVAEMEQMSLQMHNICSVPIEMIIEIRENTNRLACVFFVSVWIHLKARIDVEVKAKRTICNLN